MKTTGIALLEEAAALHRQIEEHKGGIQRAQDRLDELSPHIREAFAERNGQVTSVWDGKHWSDYQIIGGLVLPYREPSRFVAESDDADTGRAPDAAA